MKYLLFGLGLAGNYAFASHRQPTAVPPTVTLTLHPSLSSIEAHQLALPDLKGRLAERANALSPIWLDDGSLARVGRTAALMQASQRHSAGPITRQLDCGRRQRSGAAPGPPGLLSCPVCML
jgi:hypothetical protein